VLQQDINHHEELHIFQKNLKPTFISYLFYAFIKFAPGKITYHGPGQLICYFVIDLKKGKKDIRKFISVIEKSIIETLNLYDIETFADKENIGIWYNDNSTIKKVAAIGIRVSKWIAYHGFSININNDLKKYNAIVPCVIKDKGITNLKKIKNQNYDDLENKLIEIFKTNLKNLIF